MSRLPDRSLHRHRPGVGIVGALLAALLLPCTATSMDGPPAFRPSRGGVRLTDPLHQFHSPRPVHTARSESEPLSIGLVTVLKDLDHESRERGARLAVAGANRSGEVAGPGWSLEVAGVDGPWQTAATKARELLFERGCLALISPADGDTSHLIVQLASRGHVPVVSLSEVSTLTRVPVPWLFRMVPDARRQIATLLASLALPPGGSLAAVLPAGRPGRTVRSDLEALGRELSVSFRPLIALNPMDPIGPLASADPDWADLEQLKSGPLLLFLDPASTQDVLGRLNRSGFHGPVLVPSGRLDDIMETKLAPGIVLHTIRLFDPTSSGAVVFREAYRKEYGHEPDDAAAYAYDATRLLIRAIQNAGPDRSSIRDWLANSRHEPGLTGEIAFDGTGNRSTPYPILINPEDPIPNPEERTPLEEGQSP